MQTEMISLMQQLVTAVQSIALSVDVMSMDLRALNRNVAQLAKKELHKELSPLTLAPECSYSQDDETSHRATPAPTAEQMAAMDGKPPFHPPDFPGDDPGSHEKSPRIRDSLREDIKRAMGNAGPLEPSARWKRGSGDSLVGREVGEGSGWEAFGQLGLAAQDGARARANAVAPDDNDDDDKSGDEDVAEENTASNPPTSARMNTRSEGVVTNKRGKSFRCEWCGKTFPENYRLRNHLRVHTGEKPFTCFQCGKAFAYKEKLIVHSRVHSEERPFPCELCGKAFKHKENLIVHSRVHSGERPFRCDICGKMFAQNGQLTVHRRVHTGERPYRCDMCGKAFTDSGKLKRHKRVHLGSNFQEMAI